MASRSPVDPRVYELCLLGRYQWNKRTEASLKKAIEYFQQAAERDPRYGPAYAGMAESYAVLPSYSRIPMAEAFPQAKTAAQRALQLDDSLPEPHTTLGLVSFSFYLDWGGAEREFKRAVEQGSASPAFLAVIYVGLSQKSQALESLEQTYRGESRVTLRPRPDALVRGTPIGAPVPEPAEGHGALASLGRG